MTIDGRPVSYVDEGEGAAPPLLCLHGFTGAKEDFGPVLEGLAAYRRTLAVDLPGHGGSEGSDDPGDHAVSTVAAWVLRALDTLGLGDVHLLGHSLGGLVAQRVALVASERLASLVLAGSGLGAPREEVVDAARLIGITARDEGLEAAFLVSQSLARGAEIDLDPLRWRRDREAYVRARYQRLNPAAVLGGARALAQALPLGAFLRGIDVPVLVVHGVADYIWTPAEQALLAETIRGARLVAIGDSAHSPQLENPAEWSAAVNDFLNAVDAGKVRAQGR